VTGPAYDAAMHAALEQAYTRIRDIQRQARAGGLRLHNRWPPHDVRLAMLEEAVAVMRQLWQGGVQTYRGQYYTVENARLYTLPEEPPPIMVAASGPRAAEAAGRIGDGLINRAPDAEVVRTFDGNGSAGRPHYAQVTVCWARDEASARRTAYEVWRNAELTGELSQELPTPKHFEQSAQLVTEDAVAQEVVCGPDRERHIAKIQQYIDAGYEHVCVHQVGPDHQRRTAAFAATHRVTKHPQHSACPSGKAVDRPQDGALEQRRCTNLADDLPHERAIPLRCECAPHEQARKDADRCGHPKRAALDLDIQFISLHLSEVDLPLANQLLLNSFGVPPGLALPEGMTQQCRR
jgi:hypothetical protein